MGKMAPLPTSYLIKLSLITHLPSLLVSWTMKKKPMFCAIVIIMMERLVFVVLGSYRRGQRWV